MDSSQMGWMSLTNHHIFRMRFSEGCDGLGCSGPVGSQRGWPSSLGWTSQGRIPLTNYKEVFVLPVAGLAGMC